MNFSTLATTIFIRNKRHYNSQHQLARMDFVLSYSLNTYTTIIGIISLIISLFSLVFLLRSIKVNKEAPIVAGSWPILGHLPLLNGTQTPHKTLGHLANKYGPLFTLKLGSKRALVLSNWELAKECFTANDKVVSSRPRLIAVEVMAYNGAMFAFAPYGPYWRQLRKIVTLEILTNRRVEQLQHIRVLEVQTSIKELYDIWCNKKNNESNNYVLVELKQWFTKLTFNMVLQMTVGKRYFGATTLVEEKEAQRCIKALDDFMRLLGVFTVGDTIPYLRMFDIGGHVKDMKKTAKELDNILSEWLEKRRRRNKSLGEKDDGDQYIMDRLLSLIDGTTIEGFDVDTTIKATILTLFAGGAETSSVTLIWAICLLLRNPLCLKKAKEELDNHLGKERCIKESDIENLVYLQAIVKETLRLYPAAPLATPREFIENCNLGGYDVKKGTRLIVNLWKIHTDPNIWPNPLEFIPERFLTTHKDVDVRGHHFELLPFGCGRRICPGISFGLQMVHLTLASFLHSFEILNPSTEPIDMTETFGLTNTKATPFNILVKPRLSPNCYNII